MELKTGFRYRFSFPGTDNKEFATFDFVRVENSVQELYSLSLKDANVRTGSPGMRHHVDEIQKFSYLGRLVDVQLRLRQIVNDSRWFGWILEKHEIH